MNRPNNLLRTVNEDIGHIITRIEADNHYFNETNMKKSRRVVRDLVQITKLSNETTRYETLGEYEEVQSRIEPTLEVEETTETDFGQAEEEKYNLVLERLITIYEEYMNVKRGRYLKTDEKAQNEIGALFDRLQSIVTIYLNDLWLKTDYVRNRVEQVLQVELRKMERNGAYVYVSHKEKEEIILELKYNPYIRNTVGSDHLFKKVIETAIVEYGLSKEYVLDVTKEDRREIIGAIKEGVRKHLKLQDRIDGEEELYVSDITMLLNSTELKEIKEKQLRDGGEARGYESYITNLVTDYFKGIKKETKVERERAGRLKGKYPLIEKYKGIGGKYKDDILYMIPSEALTGDLTEQLYRNMEKEIERYPKDLIKITDDKIRMTQTGTELYKTMLVDSVPEEYIKISEKDIVSMLEQYEVETVYKRSQAEVMQKLISNPLEELGEEVVSIIVDTREVIETHKKSGEDKKAEVYELLYALYEILSDTLIDLVLMEKAERIEKKLETFQNDLFMKDYGRRATTHEVGNVKRMYKKLDKYIGEKEIGSDTTNVHYIYCYTREEDIKTRQDLHIRLRLYQQGDIYEIILSPYYIVDAVTGSVVFTKTDDYYEYIISSQDDNEYMEGEIMDEVVNIIGLVSDEIRVERK